MKPLYLKTQEGAGKKPKEIPCKMKHSRNTLTLQSPQRLASKLSNDLNYLSERTLSQDSVKN